MGKREIITGGVVVLSMAVGFGGMLATRLRNAANKNGHVSDEQGVKDALAAFHQEKSASFPAKSSLMDFRESSPVAATDSSPAPAPAADPAPPAAAASPIQAAQSPAPAAPIAQAADNSSPSDPSTAAQSSPPPPAWAQGSLSGDRYGTAAAPDPMAAAMQSAAAPSSQIPMAPAAQNPLAAATDPTAPATAADPATPPANDPFNRGPMGSATLGLPVDPTAPTSPAASPSAQTTSPTNNLNTTGNAATAWPPTSDNGAGLASSPNSPPPTPQAELSSQPGMMPPEQMPVVAAAAAAPAESDSRYNNEYRRRDYRDSMNDNSASTAAPATPSSDAQAQYQYVSPASPANTPPPRSQRNQYDAYGREVSRDPDPTSSDTSVQQAANQAPYTPPPVTPAPVVRDNGPESYTVRPNDNYWTISEKVYGSGAFFKAIEEHNREKYPYSDQLRVGDVVQTPRVGVLMEKYPDLCPKQRQAPAAQNSMQNTALQVGMRGQAGGRFYEVQQGDTLFDVARDELGKASRWAEIYELNRDVIGNDVDLLTPGMKLRMPGRNGTPSSDPLTTQSRQPFNR